MSLQHWQLWQENSSKLWDEYLQKRREELGQEPISGSQKVLELNRNERITAWLLYIGIWKYKSKLVIRNMLIQCICCSMLFDVVLILWKDLFLSDYKVVGSELLRRDFWCGALMLAGLPQRSAQALVLIEMKKTSGAADQPHMGWARLSFYRLKIIETYWNGFSMVFFSKVCEKMLAAPVYIRLIDVSLACFLIPKLTSSGGWWLPQIVTQDLEVVLRQSLSTLSPGNWTLKRF